MQQIILSILTGVISGSIVAYIFYWKNQKDKKEQTILEAYIILEDILGFQDILLYFIGPGEKKLSKNQVEWLELSEKDIMHKVYNINNNAMKKKHKLDMEEMRELIHYIKISNSIDLDLLYFDSALILYNELYKTFPEGALRKLFKIQEQYSERREEEFTKKYFKSQIIKIRSKYNNIVTEQINFIEEESQKIIKKGNVDIIAERQITKLNKILENIEKGNDYINYSDQAYNENLDSFSENIKVNKYKKILETSDKLEENKKRRAKLEISLSSANIIPRNLTGFEQN